MANTTNSNRKKKWLFLGLGILTAGLSLFGYNYWKKNKEKITPDSKAPEFEPKKSKTTKSNHSSTKPPKSGTKKPGTTKPKQAGPPPKTSPAPKPGAKAQGGNSKQAKPFPLKLGDKNSFVKNFQSGLIKKYGKSILPKFGADGSFGKELAAAIRKIQKLSVASAVRVSETLYKSIVGSKVLTGVEPSLIITTTPTKVWKDPHTAVSVPVNMVLGEQICQRGNFTLFRSDKLYFLVETTAIRPYQPTT